MHKRLNKIGDSYLFPHHPCAAACPTAQNEPNLPLPQPGPRSKYTKRTQSRTNSPRCASPKKNWCGKRTQFAPRQLSHDPIMRNEPNLPVRARHAVPQICETNPIPARPTANRQQPRAALSKRTQFQHTQRPAAPCFCETNPISLYGHGMPCPNYAKRTQFPHTKCPTAPDFSETNPIYNNHVLNIDYPLSTIY